MALSRDTVLAAGRRIAERDGLGAVSLRGVARELGVRPNALYTYVASSEDLVVAVADDVLAGVRRPRRGGQRWDVALRRLLRAYRELLVEQPALAARAAGGPNARGLDEDLLALLREGGIDGAHGARALQVLRAYAAGFASGQDGTDAATFDVGLRWLVAGLVGENA